MISGCQKLSENLTIKEFLSTLAQLSDSIQKTMAIAVTKKENESNEKLVSRFEKKVQQARIIQWLKKNRFFQRTESNRRIKERGLSATKYREEREKLKHYN